LDENPFDCKIQLASLKIFKHIVNENRKNAIKSKKLMEAMYWQLKTDDIQRQIKALKRRCPI